MKGRMNAVLLNGAASSMDQEACMEDLQLPIRPPLPRKLGTGGGGGNGNSGSGNNSGGPSGGRGPGGRPRP
jgi:hypothetical protein